MVDIISFILAFITVVGLGAICYGAFYLLIRYCLGKEKTKELVGKKEFAIGLLYGGLAVSLFQMISDTLIKILS